MLVLAPLAVGAFGVLVEHLLVRHLYGRMIDTMLATWGLSWRLSAWRPWPSAIPRWESRRRWAASPSASARPAATLFLVGLAAVEMLALWCLLRFTDFGLRARACMQNAAMASAWA